MKKRKFSPFAQNRQFLLRHTTRGGHPIFPLSLLRSKNQMSIGTNRVTRDIVVSLPQQLRILNVPYDDDEEDDDAYEKERGRERETPLGSQDRISRAPFGGIHLQWKFLHFPTWRFVCAGKAREARYLDIDNYRLANTRSRSLPRARARHL